MPERPQTFPFFFFLEPSSGFGMDIAHTSAQYTSARVTVSTEAGTHYTRYIVPLVRSVSMNFTASDRNVLLRLASQMAPGSPER